MQRDALVTTYRHLCRRAARKFVRPGLERCDLEQVAAIGLVKAADRYDPTLRTPFEAYAWVLILGELMHFVRDHERIVRLPRDVQRRGQQLDAAYDELTAELGRVPQDGELARRLDVPPASLRRLRQAQQAARLIRLDDRSDSAARNAAAEPVERWNADDRLLVEAALAVLPELERRIIVGIYLLGLRQLEVARRLDMSAKQVSRLHGIALSRMQRVCTDALAS
jgi:RNA polymerase sigma-B factor